MAGRGLGNSPLGISHGNEERADELDVASQIRAREAAIPREADAESVSPTPSSMESTNPDIVTPSGARRTSGQLFTTEARKSPQAPIAAKPQRGQAANINDMFTWDHSQLAGHLMAREAGSAVLGHNTPLPERGKARFCFFPVRVLGWAIRGSSAWCSPSPALAEA